MAKPHAADIIRLATAQTPAQAHIWQQALADEGIESHVVGDYMDASYGNIPGLQAELWVHKGDVEGAMKVLQDKHPLPTEDVEEVGE